MKKGVKFFLLLLLIQVWTYLFYGLNDIHIEICTHAPMLVDTSNIEHLGIHTKSWINVKNKTIIKNMLEPQFGSVDFVEEELFYYNNYRINPERYALSYDISYFIPFVAIAKEENGTLHYGEEWEVWYIWMLFRWLEVRKIPRGQS